MHVVRLHDAEVWTYRGVLAAQGSGVGCAGLFIAMISSFALLGGAILISTGLAVAAVIFLVVAAGFGLLALKISPLRDRWRLALTLVQIGLVAVGIPIFIDASSYGPETQGPFADGGNGIESVTSWAFVGGGVLVLGVLAIEEIIWFAERIVKSRQGSG
jgi:hypothetical protein